MQDPMHAPQYLPAFPQTLIRTDEATAWMRRMEFTTLFVPVSGHKTFISKDRCECCTPPVCLCFSDNATTHAVTKLAKQHLWPTMAQESADEQESLRMYRLAHPPVEPVE